MTVRSHGRFCRVRLYTGSQHPVHSRRTTHAEREHIGALVPRRVNDIDMEEWLSIKQVAKLCNITAQTVRNQLKRQVYKLTRQRPSRGRGGKTTEIHRTALFPETRRIYTVRRVAPIPASVLAALNSPARAVAEMERRVRIIHAWDRIRAEIPKTRRTQVKIAFCRARNISLSTLYNWERALRRYGHAGLLPRYPTERKHLRVMTDALKVVIRDWRRAHPTRSATVIHAMLAAYCRQTGAPLPCYSSVAHYVSSLSQSVQASEQGVAAIRCAHDEPLNKTQPTQ